MIAALLAALAVQVAATDLGEVANAIESNRLEQARQMLAHATAGGQRDVEMDRLRADLAFAKKNWSDAQARYMDLLTIDPEDGRSAERAAIASFMAGDIQAAKTLADKAIASADATWKAWNVKGVVADMEGDWASADEAFARAGSLAPDEAEVLNNFGWSLLQRGEWARAVTLLEQAAALDPKLPRIRNNLELARAAVAEDLPERRPRESDSDFAARLNDAGVVAAQQGDRDRAIAAFTRALAVSDTWYARAANNLERLQQQ